MGYSLVGDYYESTAEVLAELICSAHSTWRFVSQGTDTPLSWKTNNKELKAAQVFAGAHYCCSTEVSGIH